MQRSTKRSRDLLEVTPIKKGGERNDTMTKGEKARKSAKMTNFTS